MATSTTASLFPTKSPTTDEAAQAATKARVCEEYRGLKRNHDQMSTAGSPPKPDQTQKTWDPSRIGFFEPGHFDEPQLCTKDCAAYVKHSLALLDHRRTLTTDNDRREMRRHLQDYLRGSALEWYMSELSPCERYSLRHQPLEEG